MPLSAYLGATSFLAVHADRYVVDFQAIGVLGLAIGVGWAAEESSRLWRGALSALIFLTVLFNLLFPFGDSSRGLADRPATYRKLSILGNYPSYFAGKLGFMHYGPRRLTVVFPKEPADGVEPLFTTGSTRGRDSITVLQHPNSHKPTGQIEVYLAHGHQGTFKSRSFMVELNEPHVLELDMGSFYPPRFHPYFNGWSDHDITALKTGGSHRL